MERVLAPERSFDEALDSEPAAPVTNYLERLRSRHANLLRVASRTARRMTGEVALLAVQARPSAPVRDR